VTAKGATTMTPWAAGYIDAWCNNGRHRPLRVREDPEYRRGWDIGTEERRQSEWLRTSFGQRGGTSGRHGTATKPSSVQREWNTWK